VYFFLRRERIQKLCVGVGVLDRQTYQGGTRGSRLCGEDRDRETEHSKVCARDTGHKIYIGSSCQGGKPYVLFGGSRMAYALGVGQVPG
jgi:hypothetical protein